MGIHTEYYEKAFQLRREENNKRDASYFAKIEKAYSAQPKIAEIEQKLSAMGASLGLLAISGKTEELAAVKEQSEALSKEKEELLKQAQITEKPVICKECNDTLYIGGKICNCVHTVAKQLSYSALCKDFPIENCRFDNFKLDYYPAEYKKKMSNLFSFCLEYADNFSKTSQSLLFLGKSGLGKTHLSLAIAATVLQKGYGVIYGSAQNLFSKVEKEHFSYSGTGEQLDMLLECDLLVMDDLGAEFTTAFTQATFYNIINTRILNRKPTIISTNLTFEELAERYTARITSRFIGEYALKQFVGNDIRQIKVMEKNNK